MSNDEKILKILSGNTIGIYPKAPRVFSLLSPLQQNNKTRKRR